MNNSNINRLCGICPTCRRLIGVNPRIQYEKCPFCHKRYDTRSALNIYSTVKRNNLNNNNVQNNNYQSNNIPNQTFQNPAPPPVQERKTSLIPAICPQCHGQIQINSNDESAICQFCGTKFLVDKAINNYNINNTTVHNQGKRGVVESVLYFKDKAQERQEQRIDNEIRRRQAISERRKERVFQIINDPKKLKNFLILFFTILGVIVLTIVYFSAKSKINKAKEIKAHKGDIQTEKSASDFLGENYNDVELYLKDKGFSNIVLVEADVLPNDGDVNAEDVKAVSINGNSTFSWDDWFSPDSTVRITYFGKTQIITTTTAVTTTVVTTTVITSENVDRGNSETAVQEETSAQEAEINVNGNVTPELKQALDNYEAMIDDYIRMMNSESDEDLWNFFGSTYKYEEAMDIIDEIDEDSLSPADRAYYDEVTLRVSSKLMQASLDY